MAGDAPQSVKCAKLALSNEIAVTEAQVCYEIKSTNKNVDCWITKNNRRECMNLNNIAVTHKHFEYRYNKSANNSTHQHHYYYSSNKNTTNT